MWIFKWDFIEFQTTRNADVPFKTAELSFWFVRIMLLLIRLIERKV